MREKDVESQKPKVERISRRELLVSKAAERSRKVSTENRQVCLDKVTFERGDLVKAKVKWVVCLMRF